MANSVEKLGRPLVDDEGIEQKPILGLFGKRFRIPWSELTRWWVVDQYVTDRNTGSERLIGHVLGLEYAGTAQVLSRTDADFRRIVDSIRRHARDKEVPGDDSPLAQLTRHRR
jgi:hypothetical protein